MAFAETSTTTSSEIAAFTISANEVFTYYYAIKATTVSAGKELDIITDDNHEGFYYFRANDDEGFIA